VLDILSTIFLGGLLLFYSALAFFCFYSAFKSWRQEVRDRKREAERRASPATNDAAKPKVGSPRG